VTLRGGVETGDEEFEDVKVVTSSM